MKNLVKEDIVGEGIHRLQPDSCAPALDLCIGLSFFSHQRPVLGVDRQCYVASDKVVSYVKREFCFALMSLCGHTSYCRADCGETVRSARPQRPPHHLRTTLRRLLRAMR